MINKTSQYYIVSKEIYKSSVATTPKDETKKLSSIILIILLGLLALFCCLSMGGVFAVVGPWLIVALMMFVNKRLA